MPDRPLIIAHRGASAGAVDNSLDAFERAVELGADLIEFDVRRTRDAQLIAFHDATAGGDPVQALRREQIEARTGHTPPLLEEVLELASGRIGLDIELKEDGYVEQVVTAALERHAPERIIVTSFLDDVVAEAKRIAPHVKAGLLLGTARPERRVRTRLSELNPVTRAERCGADYVAPHVALARLGALKRAAAAGLPALVWTVNDDRTLRELLHDERVAGIITDVPGRALELRASAA